VAISSPLNPEVISPSRRINTLAAQSFISGGAPLGSSIVATAANKIVGFQRGSGAGVSPQVPDLQSIIQTLSSNILNNVENRVQSINQNVTQVVQKLTKDLESNYNQKILNLDAITPNKILQNFLSLYEKAIGYIQFFADKNNIRRLGDNLDELSKVFKETFDVAKNIRKTIVRIVNQLSSLPQAGVGSGGGINLDVDIPGGSLKKSGGTNFLRMMKKRPGLMMGGAALAGGGASNVISGMADVGGGIQAAPTGDISGGLSGPILDRFNSILDKFNAAIKSITGKPSKPKESASTKTTTSAKPEDNPPSSPNGAPSVSAGPADFSGSANAQKAFNYFISQGYTKEQSAGIVGNLMQENRALDPNVSNKQGHKGIAQWDPKIRYPGLVKFAKSKGLDPNTLEAQLQYFEQEMVTGSGGLSKKRFLSEAKTVEQSAVLMRTGFFRPGEHEAMDANRIKFGQQVLQKYGGNVKTGVAGKPGEKGTPGKPGVAGPPGQTATVVAAQTQSINQQQIARTVAQPPATQTKPQVNIVPLSMSSQQTGTGGNQKPPTMSMPSTSATNIPFLDSGNPDNFLTFYSKMVYNIVDG
jgi:hypothetical protein